MYGFDAVEFDEVSMSMYEKALAQNGNRVGWEGGNMYQQNYGGHESANDSLRKNEHHLRSPPRPVYNDPCSLEGVSLSPYVRVTPPDSTIPQATLGHIINQHNGAIPQGLMLPFFAPNDNQPQPPCQSMPP